MNTTSPFCNEFLDFLRRSPTPYHATANLISLLQAQGFERLRESEAWQLEKGKRYYFTRSDSTLVAFVYGLHCAVEHGVRIVGAHTDSPCLKVKPSPEIGAKGYHQLGVTVYGGVLLNPWFDRDLSLAGRVSYLDSQQQLRSCLVNFERPIAVIPSLAIHLDREVNAKRSINPQTDINPVLLQGEGEFCLRACLLQHLKDMAIDDAEEILDFDLSFYDVQPPAVVGLNADFIAGARFDNLISTYVSVRALIDSSVDYTCVAICHDHEEVGSRSEIGAQGTVLHDLIERLCGQPENRQIALRNSLMLSVDNAHGVHPNFASKHDDNHGPKLNAGPVLKFDANQSYATSSHNAAFIRQLARQGESLPLQEFMTRTDMQCGSTIGPLTAAKIGIKTIDMGVATFAMHSIRELAGAKDLDYLQDLLTRFYACEKVSLNELT